MEDSLKHHLIQAREHYEKREYEAAEKHLLEVVKLTQSYADVYNMLGVIHHDRGDFQEARKHFETALDINPNYTEAALNLAVTYNDLGLYGEARKTYTAMRARSIAGTRQLDPYACGKIANMHGDIAAAYAEFGLFPESAAEYRKALALSPQFADLRTRLGNALRDMGDLEAACTEYRTALKSNPKYVAARVLLGVTLLSLGKRSEAQTEWEEVLATDPENKSAQMYLRMVRGNTLKSQPPPRPSESDIPAIRLAESRPDIKIPPRDPKLPK